MAGYRTISAEDVPTNPDWWKSYVPVIGRVAAGEGMDTIEASQYPPAWAGEFVEFRGGPPSAVAVRVAGESMLPTYSQDDMLIVDTAQQAESGQVCCVLMAVEGFREARVKRLIRRGQHFLLESLNPAWSPDIVAAEKVLAAYAIVAHLPRVLR
jgi:SOS-response transcriptional repressor LexA